MDVQWQNSQIFTPHHYDMHQTPLFPTQPPRPQQQGGFYHNNNNTTIDPVPSSSSRKRKAGAPENERLSKRLSLLNLEKNGHKLYVPVDTADRSSTISNSINNSLHPVPEVVSPKTSPSPPSARRKSGASVIDDDTMQLDDTKHKVYIYDLDAELSSSEAEGGDDDSDSPTSGQGRLVFLPDIEKHLFQNRNGSSRRMPIPPSIFANSQGELAGHNIKDMQMVLYRESEPSSLTVPREQDNVRRAILEARARLRERHQQEQQALNPSGKGGEPTAATPAAAAAAAAAIDFTNGNGFINPTPTAPWPDAVDVDVDAMDMD